MTNLDKAYESLHALFGRAVVVAHLMEDLITVPRESGLAAAGDRMSAARIDVVGATDGARVVGYFAREGFMPFAAGDVMSASASLKEALAALQRVPRVFVREGEDVCGIVTRADLQKPPFRLYCFGLITLLEMHLLQLILAHYGDDEAAWCAKLSPARAQKCRDQFQARRRRGLEITLADCLLFADKRDIASGTPTIYAALGFASARTLERAFDDVQSIRDDLAHGQQLDGGREWADVIERMLEIEALLTAHMARARP